MYAYYLKNYNFTSVSSENLKNYLCISVSLCLNYTIRRTVSIPCLFFPVNIRLALFGCQGVEIVAFLVHGYQHSVVL